MPRHDTQNAAVLPGPRFVQIALNGREQLVAANWTRSDGTVTNLDIMRRNTILDEVNGKRAFIAVRPGKHLKKWVPATLVVE
jgi:hypothetical protein